MNIKPTGPVEVAARITHPSKGCCRITPDKGYSIASIFLMKKGVDVLIASDDGEESWKLTLAPPAAGEEIAIKKVADSTEILYYVRR